jgi:four helix bundle protein
MKESNLIREKSFKFSLSIIAVYRTLTKEAREFTLSKQLLRSGTSIGANVEEAIGGQSRGDFFAKLTIAYKEARETHYWLRLLSESGFIDREQSATLLTDCEELLRIITAIQKTVRASN